MDELTCFKAYDIRGEVDVSLTVEFIRLHHNPDGTFPADIPNPMRPENRSSTSEAIRFHQADFGVAWDGDFDRCFFFDEHGEFVESYYLVGLFAQWFLQHVPLSASTLRREPTPRSYLPKLMN